MSCAKKKELAEDFDKLLAAAMSEKVAPISIATERRTRPIKIVNEAGQVVDIRPHGAVLDRVAKATAIQTATQDGVRPPAAVCQALRPVPVQGGRVPKRCPTCAANKKREENKTNSRARYRANLEAERARGREKQQAQREADPDEVRAKRRAYYEANAEKVKEKARKRRQEKREQVLKEKRAYRARKKAEAAK